MALFPVVFTSMMLILHPRIGGKPTAAVIANRRLSIGTVFPMRHHHLPHVPGCYRCPVTSVSPNY